MAKRRSTQFTEIELLNQDVAISADAQVVAAASRDSKIIHIFKYDATDRPPKRIKLITQSEVDGLTIPAPQRLAVVRRDGIVEVWDLDRESRETTLPMREPTKQRYQPASTSTGGPYLVVGGDQGTVQVWNLTNGDQFRLEVGSTWGVEVAMGQDGRTLVAADHAGKVTVWDLETRQVSYRFEHGAPLDAIAISRDGKLVATSGEAIRVWNYQHDTSRPLVSVDASHGQDEVAFLNPQTLISASGDGTLRIWDLEAGDLRFTLTGHQGAVWYLGASADGRTVVSGSWDGTVRLWRAPMKTR